MTDLTDAIALLDRERPGWQQEINLDTFQQNDPDNCVLGQLYGYWRKGIETLNIRYTSPLYDVFGGNTGEEWRTYLEEYLESYGKPMIAVPYYDVRATFIESATQAWEKEHARRLEAERPCKPGDIISLHTEVEAPWIGEVTAVNRSSSGWFKYWVFEGTFFNSETGRKAEKLTKRDNSIFKVLQSA